MNDSQCEFMTQNLIQIDMQFFSDAQKYLNFRIIIVFNNRIVFEICQSIYLLEFQYNLV